MVLAAYENILFTNGTSTDVYSSGCMFSFLADLAKEAHFHLPTVKNNNTSGNCRQKCRTCLLVCRAEKWNPVAQRYSTEVKWLRAVHLSLDHTKRMLITERNKVFNLFACCKKRAQMSAYKTAYFCSLSSLLWYFLGQMNKKKNPNIRKITITRNIQIGHHILAYKERI